MTSIRSLNIRLQELAVNRIEAGIKQDFDLDILGRTERSLSGLQTVPESLMR